MLKMIFSLQSRYLLLMFVISTFAESVLYGFNVDRKFTNFGYTKERSEDDLDRLNIWFTRFYKDTRPHHSWQAFLPHNRRIIRFIPVQDIEELRL